MPPAAKITRDMILHTTLALTREQGFEAVNARSIAARLQCSTRPIFTCYENMEMLKRDFLEYAYRFYEQFGEEYGRREDPNTAPYWNIALSYIAFAQRETHLFRLLFISDMALHMAQAQDFYTEIGNEKRAAAFADAVGVDLDAGKRIFLDLFLYTHGIAVLSADKKIALQEQEAEKMIRNVLSALILQENIVSEGGIDL